MTIELHNNVYCEGEGLPVVLVHGFPVDHRMWDECAEALEAAAVEHGVKRFPIWGPDMPGAGEGPIPSDETSGGKDADGAFPNGLDHMADAYVAMLHAAGYDKAIWAGLSMAAIWFSTFSVFTRSCCRVGIVRHEGRGGFRADAREAHRDRRSMRIDGHA